MKKLLVLALFALLGCSRPAPASVVTYSFVSQLADETVALVVEDEGEAHVFCSAVWVDQYKLLTAAHCVVGAMSFTDATSDPLGFEVDYTTRWESQGAWREPTNRHGSRVQKIDEIHDLALLSTGVDTPTHPTAKLAGSAPLFGENLHFMGHPAGLVWTYIKGTVASYREIDFTDDPLMLGPFLQVSAPVWKGNSGGGAFNDRGNLVGIASFMVEVPNTAFYIHLDTIKGFLAR